MKTTYSCVCSVTGRRLEKVAMHAVCHLEVRGLLCIDGRVGVRVTENR